jgi:ArsR family transcriptional regulator, arsenate/arsenite/antimonite-responsive transcriptional repressor / arsenate reductase (thioredoxin)
MRSDAVEISSLEFLQLVSDPLRWRLLGELALSDHRVGELTELLDKPQNLVSYHLGELRKAGLVSARRSSADGRDAYYRVDLRRCGELLCAAGRGLQPGLRLELRAPEHLSLTATRAPRVLFLCTGNSARSQMAEALLEHRSGHLIQARSAGSHPKPLHANAVRVMAEHEIDISGRPTKHLSRFGRTRFDHVITLCDKVREICPDFPGQPTTAHWSMADPAAEGDTSEETYPAFRRTFEDLEERIGSLIAQMSDEAPEATAHAGQGRRERSLHSR